MNLSEEEKHVILHSLGLTLSKRIYRNHFATNEGSVDFPVCEKLVSKGIMTKRPDPFCLGSFVYHCTEDTFKMAQGLR